MNNENKVSRGVSQSVIDMRSRYDEEIARMQGQIDKRDNVIANLQDELSEINRICGADMPHKAGSPPLMAADSSVHQGQINKY